jgi:hypothetical protein
MASQGVSLQALRITRIALIGMILLYARVGEVHGPAPHPVSSLLRVIIYTLAASIIPTVLFMRSRERKRAASLSSDAAALRRWRAVQLAMLACLLAIPLYGLVLRFQGEAPAGVLPFYIVGILSLLLLPINDAERK